jgi:acyl carrier protein
VFVFLDALPLTPSGKVDRKALPAPDQSRPQLEKAFVAPRNNIEEKVKKVWSHVLSLDKIGIHDNFFEVGGNSLLTIIVRTELEKTFHQKLSVVELFQYPTIYSIAKHIAEKQNERKIHIKNDVRNEGRESRMHLVLEQSKIRRKHRSSYKQGV